jgi:hypothetical protein
MPMLASVAFVLAAADPHMTLAPPQTLKYGLDSESVVVPMRLKDGRIELDVSVDGKTAVPFILDTGAHGSVVDIAWAKEIGLTLGDDVRVGSPGGGGIAGQRVTMGRFDLGGLHVKDVPAVAFAPWPFPPSPGAARGVMSPYGLGGLLVEIDYPGKRVVFRKGALGEPDGKEIFGWDRTHGLPEIPITVAGKALVAHLDSGASSGLSLPDKLATELPLASPLTEIGRAKLVDRELVVRGAKLAGDVRIGRYVLDQPDVDFVDVGVDLANVGPMILNQVALVLDPAQSRLRIVGPADGKLVAVARPKRYGIRWASPESTPLEVAGVTPGSRAEKGGLLAGDRVVAINGRAVAEMKPDERMQVMKASPLKLQVKRGEETVELTLTLGE